MYVYLYMVSYDITIRVVVNIYHAAFFSIEINHLFLSTKFIPPEKLGEGDFCFLFSFLLAKKEQDQKKKERQ